MLTVNSGMLISNYPKQLQSATNRRNQDAALLETNQMYDRTRKRKEPPTSLSQGDSDFSTTYGFTEEYVHTVLGFCFVVLGKKHILIMNSDISDDEEQMAFNMPETPQREDANTSRTSPRLPARLSIPLNPTYTLRYSRNSKQTDLDAEEDWAEANSLKNGNLLLRDSEWIENDRSVNERVSEGDYRKADCEARRQRFFQMSSKTSRPTEK